MEGSRRYRCGSVMDLLGNEKSEELGGSIFRIFRPFCLCVCVCVLFFSLDGCMEMKDHVGLDNAPQKRRAAASVPCFFTAVFFGILSVLRVFTTKFLLVSQSFTGCTRFYRVLPGFTGFLLGFTGLY